MRWIETYPSWSEQERHGGIHYRVGVTRRFGRGPEWISASWYSPRVSGKGASVVVLGVVLFALASYAGYRVIRHYVFPQGGNSLPVFVSTCRGNTIPSGVSAHPIVTFGDSITEGYGARESLARASQNGHVRPHEQ
jgi:hypothetical protein